MNFEKIYEEYLLYSSKRYKKQSFDNLSKDFKLKILPYFKHLNIEDITEKDVIKWQNIILEFNYSNKYNQLLYFNFSKFFDFCCSYYGINKNIVRIVGTFKKKIETKKTDFYNLDEFKLFISCVDNEIYKQFFNLMFFTGTRPSEAMALKFSDLQGDYIFITKSIQRKGNRELDTPKNSSSVRTIRIDKKLKKDLLKLKECYLQDFNDYEYDYFIFGGKKPLSPTSIDRYKLKACKKANLRVITQHQFRHSHATLLLHNGVVINEISRRLGHCNVSTTLNIYTHTDLLQEKKVFNTLNSLRFNFFGNLSKDFKNFISILKQFWNNEKGSYY